MNISRLKILYAKRSVKISIQIFLFIVIYFAVKAYTQRDLIQGQAPVLNATLITGENFNLQHKRNQPMLLHFWASWCPVCKLEQDSIDSISKNHPVVTVAMQSGDSSEISQYMRDSGLNFSVIADETGALAQRYGVKAVPVSFILNPQGQIVFSESGYTSSWGLQLRLWLANFL